MNHTDKERAYRKALLRGAGRCVTMLESEAGKRDFRPLVLWACGRNLGCDTQIEGTRALFLYDLIRQYQSPKPFLDVIEEKFLLSMNKADWLFQQECELLALFAINGNMRAKCILEHGYERFCRRLRRLNPGRISGPYIPAPDNFSSLCEQLLLCEKTAEAQQLLERFVRDVGDLCMRDSFWNDMAAGVHESAGTILGDNRLATILDCMKPSVQLAAYKAALVQVEAKWRKTWPPVWGFRKVYRRIKEQGTSGIRYMVGRWRLDGRTKDIEGLAKLYEAEKDRATRTMLLDMFSNRNGGYLSLDGVLRDASSSDDKLRVSALRVLAGVRCRRVHDFALDMVKRCGVSREAVVILAGNYQEKDDDLLIAALKKLGAMRHDVHYELSCIPKSKNCDRLSGRMLAYLYETIECTCCRERIVRELGRRGLLTIEMLEECWHDASVDIRDYAERLMKRRHLVLKCGR